MLNQTIIRSIKDFPDTHFFVYKNKRYPIKINFFKLASKFFINYSDEDQHQKDIELIGEEVGDQLKLTEETIINFINYVHQKEIPLNTENAIQLHYLSTKFEIEELTEFTKDYISSHHKELAIKILLTCKYDSSINKDIFEIIIADNFIEFIKNEEILSLPISMLHRIMTKYHQKNIDHNNYQEINEFILKVISKYGREASVLISFLQIDKENIDFFEKIIQNSQKVDFQFIDQSVFIALYEAYNEKKDKIKQQHDECIEMRGEIEKMSSHISSLEAELESQKTENKNLISSHEDLNSQIKISEMTIKNKDEKIESLKAQIEKIQREKEDEISKLKTTIPESFFLTTPSLTKPGILSMLKFQQKNKFDKLFVASQSSNDIYTLLIPESDDHFFTKGSCSDFFIEFELESSITINGVKIFSSEKSFPMSFDITVDNTTVKSIKEANELNGSYKDMTINFDPIRGQKIRFTQTGPNWDNNDYFLNIKGIEILSTEQKYSRGVFATLINESTNNDAHKCPVVISASYYDFNNFQSLDASYNICTNSNENSWFQVELTKGTAILSGFRLKKDSDFKLRNYKIICTDDSNKPESSWTTLIEINESTEDEHDILAIYEFPLPSPPVRFVRLIQTGLDWSDDDGISFYHFDLFGCYF